MTTYTTQVDLNLGVLMVGFALGSIGLGLIWFGRSLWAEHHARRAEAIIRPSQQEFRPDIEAAVQAALLVDSDRSLAHAAHVLAADERLRSVGKVIPMQRRGGAS